METNHKKTFAYNYGYLSGAIEELIELMKKPSATRIEFRQKIKRLENAYTISQKNLEQENQTP